MAFVAPVLGFMPKYHNSFIHSERRAASLHGRSMSEVLGNDCFIGGLMLFLRNTGCYHKF